MASSLTTRLERLEVSQRAGKRLMVLERRMGETGADALQRLAAEGYDVSLPMVESAPSPWPGRECSPEEWMAYYAPGGVLARAREKAGEPPEDPARRASWQRSMERKALEIGYAEEFAAKSSP